MPLYMDVHTLLNFSSQEAIDRAHERDAQLQGKYGVKYLKYWFDQKAGYMFCLVEAPSREAAMSVHREAHNLTANEIYEVSEKDYPTG